MRIPDQEVFAWATVNYSRLHPQRLRKVGRRHCSGQRFRSIAVWPKTGVLCDSGLFCSDETFRFIVLSLPLSKWPFWFLRNFNAHFALLVVATSDRLCEHSETVGLSPLWDTFSGSEPGVWTTSKVENLKNMEGSPGRDIFVQFPVSSLAFIHDLLGSVIVREQLHFFEKYDHNRSSCGLRKTTLNV